MKITKKQKRYLTAIQNADWEQSRKDGTRDIRDWARKNGFVERATKAGQMSNKLTDAGKNIINECF